MKKYLLLLLMLIGLTAHASTVDFNVRDFGAKGDGKTSTTKPSMPPLTLVWLMVVEGWCFLPVPIFVVVSE